MDDEAVPLKILARPAFRGLHNPYTALIYGPMSRYKVEVFEYSSELPFNKRFDIVHVHWPDTIFGRRFRPWVLARSQYLLWFLRLQRRHGAKIVWTVHNLKAHDPRHKHHEERFWQSFLMLVDGFIAMRNGAIDPIFQRFPLLRKRPHWIIPHPHYRGQYPDGTDRAAARGRLNLNPKARTILFLGQVRQYKNVPALIRAFKGIQDRPDFPVQLVIAGLPRGRELTALVRKEAANDPRIRLDLQFIDDDAVQYYLRASDLVVIPYQEILNSGSAVLALSFDRPVLIPQSSCFSDLAGAVPGDWVLSYDGDLTGGVLEAALQSISELPERTDGDHLAALCPAKISAATVAAYRQLIAGVQPLSK